MSEPVPSDLMGLWRREVITAPGFRDDTTRVVWLQTPRWYADLRVRIDRPGPSGRRDFTAYDDADLIALARTQGFGGELTAADGVCFWRRDMDCQPAGPEPDEARYSIDGGVMIEDGIHSDYQEIWRRAADSQGPFAAFRLIETGGRSGLLVMAGRHLLEFVARPGPAPEGESLAALVERALADGRRADAEALLDTQIRYAVNEDGDWNVKLSSMPWLENQPIWPAGATRFDAGSGVMKTTFGAESITWTLLEFSGPAGALERWIKGGVQMDAAIEETAL
jgi:hypothetical protein